MIPDDEQINPMDWIGTQRKHSRKKEESGRIRGKKERNSHNFGLRRVLRSKNVHVPKSFQAKKSATSSVVACCVRCISCDTSLAIHLLRALYGTHMTPSPPKKKEKHFNVGSKSTVVCSISSILSTAHSTAHTPQTLLPLRTSEPNNGEPNNKVFARRVTQTATNPKFTSARSNLTVGSSNTKIIH